MATVRETGSPGAGDAVGGDNSAHAGQDLDQSVATSTSYQNDQGKEMAKMQDNPFLEEEFQTSWTLLKLKSEKNVDLGKICKELNEHILAILKLWDDSSYNECLKAAIALGYEIIGKCRTWTGSAEEKKLLQNLAKILTKIAAQVKTHCSRSKEEYEYYSLVESEIAFDCGDVMLDHVCGLASQIDFFKEKIILPVRFPQLFRNYHRWYQNLLIYGHPGCGKTLLLTAIANEAAVSLFVFNLHILGTTRHTEKGKCIRTAFEVARNNRPCILCLEDIDVVMRDRDSVTELLCQIGSVDNGKGCDDEYLFIVAVTQKPWDVNYVLRRRFGKKHIGLPITQGRVDCLKLFLSRYSHDLENSDLVECARRTEGFTGSDLLVLVHGAAMLAIRAVMESQYFRKVVVSKTPDGKLKEVTESGNSKESSEGNTEAKAAETPVAESTQEQKFVPCGAKDRGAVKMKWTDIPADQLLVEPEVTKEAMMAACQDARPSICDEDQARMQQFVADFE